VADLLACRRIGLMVQPKSNLPRPGWLWALDNGCFSDGWHEGRWRRFVARADLPRAGCLFAVVPDVVADIDATLARFDRYCGFVRSCGWPLAFAAQDRAEQAALPWRRFDCLFIGGSTAWKLSDAARAVAVEARARGKWVHVGRINSQVRYRAWSALADSCDGSVLAFGPATNVGKVVRWTDDHYRQPQFDLQP